MVVREAQSWRGLATQFCHDLATAAASPPALIARGSLGPADHRRLAALRTGRVGREELLAIIERSRVTLDADFDEPARWRGSALRSATLGHRRPSGWLPLTSADLADLARTGSIEATVDRLVAWNRAVGASGEWRTRAMRVDGQVVPYSPQRSRALVDHLLARAITSTEARPTTAARLHLGLLLAHPFRDGNGRTARVAAAAVLVGAGYRSSLLTCVEQHYRATPGRYGSMLGRLRRGEITIDRMLDDLLAAMAANAVLAAWLRERHRRLFAAALVQHPDDPAAAVAAFERGAAGPLDATSVVPFEPWHRLQPHFDRSVARQVRWQLAQTLGDGATGQSNGSSTGPTTSRRG